VPRHKPKIRPAKIAKINMIFNRLIKIKMRIMTAKIGQKMFAKIATLGKIDAPAPSKKPPQIVAMKIDG